jgi:phosphopantetheinyl transferase
MEEGFNRSGSVTVMWLGPASSVNPCVSNQEHAWACTLGLTRQRRFLNSRAWMRSCLSDLWGVPALEIPLHAPPGSPPTLSSGWGFVSLSHSKGSALMAWSSAPVGVDLERLDRPFSSQARMSRYYASSEQRRLRSLPKHAFHQAVLEHWLIKEAAIKWQQGSLAQDLTHWVVAADGLSASHQGRGFQVSAHCRQLGPWGVAIVSACEQNLIGARVCLG